MRLAAISTPGVFWNVAATFTSAFGTRYVPSIFTCVRKAACTRQSEARSCSGSLPRHHPPSVGDNVTVVRRGSTGAQAALEPDALLQPRVHREVHAIPVLGLLAEVVRERRVVRLPRPRRRVEIVEAIDGVSATVREPRSIGATTLYGSKSADVVRRLASPGSCRTSAGSTPRRWPRAGRAHAARSSRTPSCRPGCPTRSACPRRTVRPTRAGRSWRSRRRALSVAAGSADRSRD